MPSNRVEEISKKYTKFCRRYYKMSAAHNPTLFQEDGFENLPVLNIWTFTIRRLTLTTVEKKPFIMRSASQVRTEKEAVKEIRQRFTPEWWEDKIIQEVEHSGDLHMIDGTPLYEKD